MHRALDVNLMVITADPIFYKLVNSYCSYECLISYRCNIEESFVGAFAGRFLVLESTGIRLSFTYTV